MTEKKRMIYLMKLFGQKIKNYEERPIKDYSTIAVYLYDDEMRYIKKLIERDIA